MGDHNPPRDLPLRDDSSYPTVRESLIDLDSSLDGSRLSRFADIGTVTMRARSLSSDRMGSDNRRTQEWTFPAMVSSSADLVQPASQPEHDRFLAGACDNSASADNMNMAPGQHFMHAFAQENRSSTVSLIDLDASLEVIRPSTTKSDAVSTASGVEETPFKLQRHISKDYLTSPVREPSIYVAAGFESQVETSLDPPGTSRPHSLRRPENWDSVRLDSIQADTGRKTDTRDPGLDASEEQFPILPYQPSAPSGTVMQGTSSREKLREELQRLISSMSEHLQFASQVLGDIPTRQSESPLP